MQPRTVAVVAVRPDQQVAAAGDGGAGRELPLERVGRLVGQVHAAEVDRLAAGVHEFDPVVVVALGIEDRRAVGCHQFVDEQGRGRRAHICFFLFLVGGCQQRVGEPVARQVAGIGGHEGAEHSVGRSRVAARAVVCHRDGREGAARPRMFHRRRRQGGCPPPRAGLAGQEKHPDAEEQGDRCRTHRGPVPPPEAGMVVQYTHGLACLTANVPAAVILNSISMANFSSSATP